MPLHPGTYVMRYILKRGNNEFLTVLPRSVSAVELSWRDISQVNFQYSGRKARRL